MRHIIALHCIANINVYLPPENVPSLRLSASIFRILCQKCCLEPSLDQRLCLGHALEHLVSSWLRTGAGCRERVMSGDPDTHSGSPPQPAPQVTPAEYILGTYTGWRRSWILWESLTFAKPNLSTIILLLQKPLLFTFIQVTSLSKYLYWDLTAFV